MKKLKYLHQVLRIKMLKSLRIKTIYNMRTLIKIWLINWMHPIWTNCKTYWLVTNGNMEPIANIMEPIKSLTANDGLMYLLENDMPFDSWH